MQFTIERDALLDGLTRVVGVVRSKADVPIFRNCLIKATGKELATFRAYGDDIEVAVAAPADVIKSGVLTCEARLLHEIARKCGSGTQLALSYEKKSGLTVKCGRARFQLATLPVDDFPSISIEQTSSTAYELPAMVLRSLIEGASYAASGDETRYYLCGVYLTPIGEQLATIATDGKRLSKCGVDLPPGAAGSPGIILSRASCAEMLRFLPENDVTVEMHVSATRLHLTLGHNELITKLIDGTFPDWQRLVPASDLPKAIVPREKLLKATQRVATVLDDSKGSIKIEFFEDNLQITARGVDRGSEAHDLADDCVWDGGSAVTVGVNARLLLDTLSATEAKQLALSFIVDKDGGVSGPIRFDEVDGDPQRLALLMPVRLTNV